MRPFWSHTRQACDFAKKVRIQKQEMVERFIFIFTLILITTQDLGNEKVIVFMAFNAKEIELPARKNGKFIVGARSSYAKLFNKLFPGDAMRRRLSPKNLLKKLFLVRVRTVRINEKQKPLADYEKYSVVDEVIDFG